MVGDQQTFLEGARAAPREGQTRAAASAPSTTIANGVSETCNERRWTCARMLAGRSTFRVLAILR